MTAATPPLNVVIRFTKMRIIKCANGGEVVSGFASIQYHAKPKKRP